MTRQSGGRPVSTRAYRADGERAFACRLIAFVEEHGHVERPVIGPRFQHLMVEVEAVHFGADQVIVYLLRNGPAARIDGGQPGHIAGQLALLPGHGRGGIVGHAGDARGLLKGSPLAEQPREIVVPRAVLGWLRRQAMRRGVMDGRGGAVAIIPRFGAALNLNVHIHALVRDGVCASDGSGGALCHSHERQDDDVGPLLVTIQRRIEPLLHRRGVSEGREGFEAPDRWTEDAPAMIRAAWSC